MDRNERIETNRGRFDELQKRHAVIRALYPDIQNAPQSVKDEYFAISSLTFYLRKGLGNYAWGEKITEDGYVIDSFQEKNYKRQLERYNSMHEENAEIITEEDISKVELLKPNFEEVKSRISNAKTDDEVYGVISEIQDMQHTCTLDEMFELEDMYKSANHRFVEIEKERERKEAEAKAKEAEEKARAEAEKPKGFWENLKNKVKGAWAKIFNGGIKKLDAGERTEVATKNPEPKNNFADEIKVSSDPLVKRNEGRKKTKGVNETEIVKDDGPDL